MPVVSRYNPIVCSCGAEHPVADTGWPVGNVDFGPWREISRLHAFVTLASQVCCKQCGQLIKEVRETVLITQ